MSMTSDLWPGLSSHGHRRSRNRILICLISISDAYCQIKKISNMKKHTFYNTLKYFVFITFSPIYFAKRYPYISVILFSIIRFYFLRMYKAVVSASHRRGPAEWARGPGDERARRAAITRINQTHARVQSGEVTLSVHTHGLFLKRVVVGL